MITAIIGVGNLGRALAGHLVAGDELVVLAAQNEEHAVGLAHELGPRVEAALVEDAIAAADVVVLALWLDQIKALLAEEAHLLENKVVIDPSNPIGFDDNGQMVRTLPDGQAAGSIVASLLPASAHYVKAFGTLGADSLASSANREPRRVALFYATDDDVAGGTVERLIGAAGFDPVKAGGFADAIRLEGPNGDLSQGGLNGELLDLDQARATLAATEVTA
ncbi:MAG TPA: NAD(P)-binding domain-containing protein [Gaiellaceae bacterium]